MKKISIYAIICISLFSCETRENEINLSGNDDTLLLKRQPTSGPSFKFIENQLISCGSSYEGNPFIYEPNMNGIFLRYTTDKYNMYFSDDTDVINDCNSNNGKQCLTLSKFVGSGIISLTEMRKIKWFFGEQEFYNGFFSAPGVHSEDFTIGQDGDNAQMYGDLFWSPNYYMTDIASNSIRQKFKDKVDELKAQNKKIKSVSIYTKGLLCVPTSYKYIKMSVKYDY